MATLSSLAITTQPTKTTYAVGDTLDLTGIVVTATYTDSTTADVTSSCVFSPAEGAEFESSGAHAIRVSYEEGLTVVRTTFTITVEDAAIEYIEIVSMPVKLEYKTGDTLILTGIAINGMNRNAGRVRDVTGEIGRASCRERV